MSWNHLRDETRKAKKSYRCRICNELIKKDSQHSVRIGTDEVGFCSIRFHEICLRYADNTFSQTDWEICSPGDVKKKECEEYYK